MVQGRVNVHGIRHYIRQEIWRVCLQMVEEEAIALDMCQAVAGAPNQWIAENFSLRGMIPTGGAPLRFVFL